VASIVMPPGAKLYIFSDGAFEILTAQRLQWSIDDLRQVILHNQTPELPEPQRLFKAVRAAARPGPLDDDFSVLHICFE
jgi:serine phosphatase RsbU (regulator of sigma subunit)